MGLLITSDDFSTGRTKIGINPGTKPDLDKYILDYEESLLTKMLGYDLFALFKADVNPTTKIPVTAKYVAIYDKITSDDLTGCPVYSLGLKETIKRLIYYYYMRDMVYQPTLSGPARGNSETAKNATFDQSNLYSRYNEAVRSIKTIQDYILKDIGNNYPDYNGECFKLVHWAL